MDTAQAHTTPAASAGKTQDAAVAAHGTRAPPSNAGDSTDTSQHAGQHPETIQTTTNHPWLTAAHGWLPADFLRIGERVVRADGGTATVVAVRAVAGVAAMWDLTIGAVHTFAVGDGRYVVHNADKCGVTSGETGSYGDLAKKSKTGDGLDLHHMPADSYIETLGVERDDGFAVAMEHGAHRGTWTYKGRAKVVLKMIEKEGLSFPEVLDRDLADYRLNGGANPDQVANAAREFWGRVRPDLMVR